MVNFFRTEFLQEANQIRIYLSSDDYLNKIVRINISDVQNHILWTSDLMNFYFHDQYYWFASRDSILNSYGYIIQIYHEDNLIFEEKNRLKTIYGMEIKKQCIYICDVGGIGDHIAVEPLVRKVSDIFEQKIIVFTSFPEIYKNHPNVDKVVHVYERTHHINWISIPDEYNDKNRYNVKYVFMLDRDIQDNPIIWASYNPSKLAAQQYGIQLNDDELEIRFYPDEFIEIENLPENYVCINPSITGSDRTWSKENWQKLVDILNINNINIVSIGKGFRDFKGYYDLNIEKGLNLCGKDCQNTLSQLYHIINKSQCFITFNSGAFMVSLSTLVSIIELGSPVTSYDYYRNGIKNYNHKYIEGDCNMMCYGDVKYSALLYGKIDILNYCFISSPYKCHPTPEKVADYLLSIL